MQSAMRAAAKRSAFVTPLGFALALATVPVFAQRPDRSAGLPSLAGTAEETDSVENSDDRPARRAQTPQELYEHVRRGVVVILRGGAPSAVGTVLADDGRVLTALSGLAGESRAEVRYADGTAVDAKLEFSDRALDLALLTPSSTSSARRTEGLRASEVNPEQTQLRAMLPTGNSHLGPAIAAIRGRASARSRSGTPLAGMWDVDVQGAPVLGSPLLDPTGNVVAVLVRACKPARDPEISLGSWPTPSAPAAPSGRTAAGDCRPVIVGAAISAVRSFLARTPAATSASPAPWLGIRAELQAPGGLGGTHGGPAVQGVRVVAVAPSSPAEKAGLKPVTDVIVAVDGRPMDRPETLGDAIAGHSPGDTAKILVFDGQKFRDLAIVLGTAPETPHASPR